MPAAVRPVCGPALPEPVRVWRAVLAGVLLGLLMTVGLGSGMRARPAGAHALGGPEPDNFLTRFTGVQPPLPGVSARVVEAGNRLELTSTPYEVVVIGYEGEPYLRIGPGGSYENQRSTAAFLNRDRRGSISPPSDLKPTDPPQWKKVASGGTYRWHDHRIHWMGTQLPAEVAVDPGRFHALPERSWSARVQLTDSAGVVQQADLKGTIDWVPGPDPTGWFVLAGAVGLALVAAAVAGYGRYAVVAGLAVAIGADVVHVTGLALSAGVTLLDGLWEIVSGGLTSVPGWVIGALSVRPVLRRSVDALYAAGVAGITVAIFGGYLDFATITSSQIPTAWSFPVARAVVALAIGAGTGTLLAAAVTIVKAGRHQPQAAALDTDGDDGDDVGDRVDADDEAAVRDRDGDRDPLGGEPVGGDAVGGDAVGGGAGRGRDAAGVSGAGVPETEDDRPVTLRVVPDGRSER